MSEDILITFEQGSITVDNSYDLDPITVEVTPEGKDGISLVPCGAWSSTRGYDYLSIVYHDGASYLALKNVPAGTALTNDEYWTVFAAQDSDPTSRSANWGLIRGDMANQLDLQSALGLKANSTDVYTKTETDSLLNDKADADNVYTKTETDGLLADKADSADVYTKTESDTLLSNKANSADVYTKTEADDLLADKADSDDVYTKVEADGLLADKADADDVYTKTETDNLLSTKANTADVYSKTDADTLLSAKANSADVYTKTEANSLLNAKANSADLGTMSAENTSDYYTKTATDNLLNAKANTSDLGTMSAESASDYYTKTATDTLLSAKANTADLGSLADQDTVNYQTEVTNKPTLGALADHDTVNYSTEVTNKPTLGTMSAESASDYYDKTEVYTKSEVDTLINGSGVVGEKTASGSIVTFETTLAENLGELKVGIEPVQDLHGYDNPWPAGGGANIWDEQWELGSFDSQGNPSGSTSSIRCKNFIPVVPGNTYRYINGSGSSQAPWLYDENQGFIQRYGSYMGNGTIITIPEGCYFIKFALPGTYGATYKNDVSWNYPSTVTTYQPYENVCPITGHTQAMVTRTGKNILPVTATTQTINDVTFTVNDDGSVTVNGTASANAIFYLKSGALSDILTDGESYVLNGCPSGGSISTYQMQLRVGTNTYHNDVGSGVSFTFDSSPDSASSFVRIIIFNGQSITNKTFYPMIRLSSDTASSYSAYTGTSVTIDLGGTRYGGTLDVVNGVMTVTHGIATANDMTGFFGTTSGGLYYAQKSVSAVADGQGYSSMLVQKTTNSAWVSTTECFAVESTRIRAYTKETTLENFKSVYSALQIVYPLATPLTVQLTANQIQALVGQNVMWASTGDIEVGYYTNDTSEAINDTRQMMADTTTTMTAPRNLTVNEFVIVNNRLYKVTANVASGSALVVGTNVTETTVAEVLTALLNA